MLRFHVFELLLILLWNACQDLLPLFITVTFIYIPYHLYNNDSPHIMEAPQDRK